jgi:hypothetical protein
MGDQALVQVAHEHRDAVGPGVVVEEVAGHAHLAAAAAEQHRLIEPGPVLDRLLTGGEPAGGRDGAMTTTEAYACTSRGVRDRARCAERPAVAGRHRAAINSQRPTATTPAAGSQGVTRRKGYASAALPHPCPRVILLPSLPPGMGFFGHLSWGCSPAGCGGDGSRLPVTLPSYPLGSWRSPGPLLGLSSRGLRWQKVLIGHRAPLSFPRLLAFPSGPIGTPVNLIISGVFP